MTDNDSQSARVAELEERTSVEIAKRIAIERVASDQAARVAELEQQLRYRDTRLLILEPIARQNKRLREAVGATHRMLDIAADWVAEPDRAERMRLTAKLARDRLATDTDASDIPEEQ